MSSRNSNSNEKLNRHFNDKKNMLKKIRQKRRWEKHQTFE